MADEETIRTTHAWSTFPRDWWLYVRGPRSFVAFQDLKSKGSATRATKYLVLGLSGAVAISAVNLKFSPYAASDVSKKLFEGEILTFTLAQSCIITALLSHLFARILNGSGTLRETYSSFSLTYGFIWPLFALALICIGWFVRLTTNLDLYELPPFEVSTGPLERSTKNILVIAFAVTLYLWIIGFLLYCYCCAVWAAHRFGPIRCFIVVAVSISTMIWLESPLAKVTYKVAETLDPVIKWLLKLL